MYTVTHIRTHSLVHRDGGHKVMQLAKEKGAEMKRLLSTVQVYKMRPIMDKCLIHIHAACHCFGLLIAFLLT